MTSTLDTVRSMRHLRNRLLVTGGFSFDLQSDTNPETGFAVSCDPKETRVLDTAYPTVADLWLYIADKSVALSLPGKVFGGWVDRETGKTHLDVVTIVDDIDKAKELGVTHHEIAIFDLVTRTEIRL
jgi:hypothetical protein